METPKQKLERADQWLAQVSNGTLTMSQRTLTSIEKYGGLQAVKKRARLKGVHLLRLIDDKGQELIAASRHPFKVIC